MVISRVMLVSERHVKITFVIMSTCSLRFIRRNVTLASRVHDCRISINNLNNKRLTSKNLMSRMQSKRYFMPGMCDGTAATWMITPMQNICLGGKFDSTDTALKGASYSKRMRCMSPTGLVDSDDA